MNFKPKLVIFDLDGTLAENQQPVSVETGELLGELLKQMPVAVMSGARFGQFELQVLPAVPDSSHFERLFLFPTNAAQCYRQKGGSWQIEYNRSFNPFERGRIIQALKEALVEVGLGDDSRRLPAWGERVDDRGAQITFSALGLRAPAQEKSKWDPTSEKRKLLRVALLRRLPDFEVRINGSTSLDITHKGINKAYGIRQLVKLTDISIAEMLYVGDALTEGWSAAVVVDTGIHTHEVFGPEETAALIKDILKNTRLSTATA